MLAFSSSCLFRFVRYLIRASRGRMFLGTFRPRRHGNIFAVTSPGIAVLSLCKTYRDGGFTERRDGKSRHTEVLEVETPRSMLAFSSSCLFWFVRYLIRASRGGKFLGTFRQCRHDNFFYRDFSEDCSTSLCKTYRDGGFTERRHGKSGHTEVLEGETPKSMLAFSSSCLFRFVRYLIRASRGRKFLGTFRPRRHGNIFVVTSPRITVLSLCKTYRDGEFTESRDGKVDTPKVLEAKLRSRCWHFLQVAFFGS